MPAQRPDQLPMIERVEHALLLLAYCIELDGDIHLPMYEKFEAELAALQTTHAVRERAGRRLETFRNMVSNRSNEPSVALPVPSTHAQV